MLALRHGRAQLDWLPERSDRKVSVGVTYIPHRYNVTEVRQRAIRELLPDSLEKKLSVWQAHDASRIKKFAKNVASDLARIDFKEKWSRRWFQEGLETSRVEVALLKIWTAIEALCAREEREPTQRVVERASSIFDNFRHAAMRLNFIQDYRNRVVHRGEAGDHALLCAQYGSLYLAAHIWFFLWNIYKSRKREEILDFLSLPLDMQRLKSNIALNRTRLKAATRMAAREAESRS